MRSNLLYLKKLIEDGTCADLGPVPNPPLALIRPFKKAKKITYWLKAVQKRRKRRRK